MIYRLNGTSCLSICVKYPRDGVICPAVTETVKIQWVSKQRHSELVLATMRSLQQSPDKPTGRWRERIRCLERDIEFWQVELKRKYWRISKGDAIACRTIKITKAPHRITRVFNHPALVAAAKIIPVAGYETIIYPARRSELLVNPRRCQCCYYNQRSA